MPETIPVYTAKEVGYLMDVRTISDKFESAKKSGDKSACISLVGQMIDMLSETCVQNSLKLVDIIDEKVNQMLTEAN